MSNPTRVPALASRNEHPASDLPERPPQHNSDRNIPAEDTTNTPIKTGAPEIPRTTTTGPDNTYGIVYPGSDGLYPHNVRIKNTTKDRLDAALDILRKEARIAGGDRRLINLGSITDRALEEFIERHCSEQDY